MNEFDNTSHINKWPRIIQGGMGVGISNWKLAKSVSSLGQLGVVSGTALDTVLLRRFQSGHDREDILRALRAFPNQDCVKKFLSKYERSDGSLKSFSTLPMMGVNLSADRQELLVLGNFVEVYLAKEGHGGNVGINFLEKVQLATLPSLYGALLAGVDYVLMGAGIPWEIPEALDRLVLNEEATLTLDVVGAGTDHFKTAFNPKNILANEPRLNRPKFFPIIASATLAIALLKKTQRRVDGFVIEGPTAGGHNAPPRGELHLSERGEPIYGERDAVDLEKMKELGIPFWLAGGYASAGRLNDAISKGAVGVQLGTAFAFCDESGLAEELKLKFLKRVFEDSADVFTDPRASPTGFPFKVARLDGTLSEDEVYQQRPRRCDLGYLRQLYKREDGSVGYRCGGEPITDYLRKGGQIADTEGRKCLCNALLSNIGLGALQPTGYAELPLVTVGDDVECLKDFVGPGSMHYSARDVVEKLLS